MHFWLPDFQTKKAATGHCSPDSTTVWSTSTVSAVKPDLHTELNDMWNNLQHQYKTLRYFYRCC